MPTKQTTRPKPKTPKPHALAFIGDAPCPICGCEWFRPTIRFVEDAAEAVEGVACANLWCGMIARLRTQIMELSVERRTLARLAADTPQFNNPLEAWDAQALRDRILAQGPR